MLMSHKPHLKKRHEPPWSQRGYQLLKTASLVDSESVNRKVDPIFQTIFILI